MNSSPEPHDCKIYYRLVRFPGSDLDHLGHSLERIEAHGFEIHDIEGRREHYAQTCKLWYHRLVSQDQQAKAFIGEECYRLWLLYLTREALAFSQGNLRIYQTLGSKHQTKGASGMPPTRAELY